MTRLLLCLLLSGCGHLTFDLKAHEEDHCREFGVPDDHWMTSYRPWSEARAHCEKVTGLPFTAACAQHVGPFCFITLSTAEHDQDE